ncbi:MAG: hypothetical protein MUF63_09510, partial [Rhodobacteraceae bacterium]|nr:hypothetical protein [Paracoccaceae bacterium]
MASGSAAPDPDGCGRGQRRLDRARGGHVGQAECVAGVGAERVLRHEVIGHPSRQIGRLAAFLADAGGLRALGLRPGGKLGAFAGEVGLF